MGLSRKVVIVLVNLLAVLSYVVASWVFTAKGKPFIRGFYCTDESISKPYPESQAVTAVECGVYIVAVSLVCIIVVEFIKIRAKNKMCYGGSRHWKAWGTNVLYLIMAFAYGLGITVFVTDIGKYSIGRLRPHFLDVCKPDWNRINCTNVYGLKNFIIGDEYCTTDNLKRLKEARLSFPSGHGATTGFGAVFLIFYIQHRVTLIEKWFSLSKLFVQVLLGCGAFYVGLSRVSNYMHHPIDVVVGFLIGVVFGLVIDYLILYKFIPCNDEEQEPEEESEQELSANCPPPQ